jgi:uncharacterized protein
MNLSILTFLDRILASADKDGDADWFERGVAAYTKKRYVQALDAWKRASTRGDMESDYRIGLLYARGEGVIRSLPDAGYWYRRAAEAGHTEAQYQLGLIYFNGANSAPQGLDCWLDAASRQNCDAAQQTLDALFPHGIAVEKDFDEARRWIWAAAAAGKIEAQSILGEIYRQGLGVPQDYQEAQRWYWLAAQQGVAAAQFAMGDLYYQGLGVPVDHCIAADWYEMAAKNGDPRAQVALASMYLTGQGKTKDQKQAARLFVQAAEQGEVRGLYQAALLHLKGEGLPENIDKAETYLRKSAKRSYLPAIIGLAQFYAHGKGVEPDLREAAVWYLEAAELGDVQSQFIIGRLYATGTGVPINLRQSARWFLAAAEQDSATAAHNIATYYAKGTGVERDVTKSIEWYQIAAAAGITASQVQLGKMYSVGDGVPRDRNLAADWLQQAAQSGDPEAQTALAMLHLQAEEGVRDPSRAEELLKQAAEGGHSAAAMQLGHLYSGKYAVDARVTDAVRWYTKAAEAGTIEAQHILGMLYLNGRGVAKNLETAASWIEKAAVGGHAPSQFQLAVMYCTAQGVAQDLAEAVFWYQQAAQRGHPLAQYNLGVMLSKGQGCGSDEACAAFWFQEAAEQGLAEAKRAVADRGGRLSVAGDRTSERSLDQEASSARTPRAPDQPPAQPSSRSTQKMSNEGPHSARACPQGPTDLMEFGGALEEPEELDKVAPQGPANLQAKGRGSNQSSGEVQLHQSQEKERSEAHTANVPGRDAVEASPRMSSDAAPTTEQTRGSKQSTLVDLDSMPRDRSNAATAPTAKLWRTEQAASNGNAGAPRDEPPSPPDHSFRPALSSRVSSGGRFEPAGHARTAEASAVGSYLHPVADTARVCDHSSGERPQAKAPAEELSQLTGQKRVSPRSGDLQESWIAPAALRSVVESAGVERLEEALQALSQRQHSSGARGNVERRSMTTPRAPRPQNVTADGLDGDNGAGGPIAVRRTPDAHAPSERGGTTSSPLRSESPFEDAVTRVMSEIADCLRTPTHRASGTALSLAGGGFAEKAYRPRALQQSETGNNRGRSQPTSASSKSKTFQRTGAVSVHDQATLKEVTRATADLGIRPQVADSPDPRTSEPPSHPDVLHRVPAPLKPRHLPYHPVESAGDRKHDAQTAQVESGVSAGRTVPNLSRSNFGQEKPSFAVVPDACKSLSADAPSSSNSNVSNELEQAVQALNVDSVSSRGTPNSETANGHMTAERESGVVRQANNDGAPLGLPGHPTGGSEQAAASSIALHSADQLKCRSADSFLSDLTRQLDGIELPSRSSSKS